MLAKEDDERERMALIDDLTRSTNRATHLVEQLLRVARVSHQPVNMKALPLYHTTASVIAEMANVAAEKQLDISLEGQKEASVRADELLMKLMISNLMDNAIKYTPASGTIRINVLPQDGMWCLSIRDTGPGISESEREAVFHRFYRAANAVTDGTGLGLAIVGEIIDRMSAKITLKTPESGQGLRVEVLLPKA
jgi:signal transduction histidine kinase